MNFNNKTIGKPVKQEICVDSRCTSHVSSNKNLDEKFKLIKMLQTWKQLYLCIYVKI